MQTIIIGCGNRHRGDDAAGLLVLEKLDKLRGFAADFTGVTLKACRGEATELIDCWSANDESDQVVIVDAVVTGAPIGTVHRWQDELPAAARTHSASTHGFGVHEAIRLAQALHRLPKSLRVYGIEAGQFTPGAAVSPEVRHAITELAQQIWTEIGKAAAV